MEVVDFRRRTTLRLQISGSTMEEFFLRWRDMTQNSEELPNAKSIDFSQELDKLLEEVCRIAPIT